MHSNRTCRTKRDLHTQPRFVYVPQQHTESMRSAIVSAMKPDVKTHEKMHTHQTRQNTHSAQRKLQHRVHRLWEFPCNTRKSPFILYNMACGCCHKKHMWHNSPVMITIMENAYICEAHICSRHLIRTLYPLFHVNYKPTLLAPDYIWGN